jgi:flagellar FliJ protein
VSAKSINTLIRLHEFDVDEHRRRLGNLLRLVEALENQAVILQEELSREQATANASPEVAAFTYGNYAQMVIGRRAWIENSVAKAEDEVTAAREALRDAYQDLKRYEIGKDIRDRLDKAELERLERLVLDEVGLQGFRQRNS